MASPKPVSTRKSASSNVRVKPAAKPVPNPPNQARANYKSESTYNRAYRAARQYETNDMYHGNLDELHIAAREQAFIAQKNRKVNITNKKLEAEKNKPSFPRPNKKTVKIDSGNKSNKSTPAAKKANAKALKAANKPGPLRVRRGPGLRGGGLNIGDVQK